MDAKSLPFSYKVDSAQGSDLTLIFRGFNQSEKHSEIKPPLKYLLWKVDSLKSQNRLTP